MHIGLIGLGKMGYNLGLNMIDHGHQVTAYDVNAQAIERFIQDGGQAVASLQEVVDSLPTPRVLWIMVPHQLVDDVLRDVKKYLIAGDIIIEGGNSRFQDSIRRSKDLEVDGIYYFDCGTSGGMEGARYGACYMIGGDADVFKTIEPIFKDTAVPNGYLYTGRSGSGHYCKMVHNGIEYGMMQAIGEGFDVLKKSEFDFDYEQVARVWSNGSVIRGWLMELTQSAFAKDANLDEIKGVMHASGEGLWTVEEALRTRVPVPIIAMSLMMRNRSLEDDTFTGKVVAALRNEFGGHAVQKKGE